MTEKTKSTFGEDASTKSLSQAIISAQQLIDYAASNSKDIKPDVLKALVEVKYLQDKLTPENEETFWQAYYEISKAIQPVTLVSLQATRDAQRVIKTFQIVTVIAIVFLLFFQVYWVLLTTLQKTVNADYLSIQSTKTEIENQWLDLLSQGSLYGIKEMNTILDRGSWVVVSDQSTREKILTKLDQFTRGGIDLQSFAKSYKTNYRVLSLIDPFTPQIPTDDNLPKNDTNTITKDINGLSTTSYVTATVLTTYFLPMLYGLVGSCAYILRVLSEYIDNNTFTISISVRLRLRWLLGILAGLSIGWFFNPESLTATTGHITPLALAFVAGYSVELLFSIMDALISAFTRKEISQSFTSAGLGLQPRP